LAGSLPGSTSVPQRLDYQLAMHTLLADNPFPVQLPTWVRGPLYHYRFTTSAERAATGDCWVREPLGPYVPPLSLESWESH